MQRFRLSLFFALVGAWLAGCQHAAVAPVADEGTSSFKFVEPPPPSPAKKAAVAVGAAQPADQVSHAQPIWPLAKPEYPATALAAHAGLATVGVCITVDTEGRVSDVGLSPFCLSTPSPFAAEFRASVEAAVARWRFRPAEIRHFEIVKHPDGDYLHLKSRETVEWKYDVSFTFNAKGDVLAGLP
jgi:hypothetical protein